MTDNRKLINFILAVMALQHKNIGLVYKISVVTLIFPLVFNIVVAGNSSGYLSAVTGAIIPAPFWYSAFNQNKIDQAK